MGTILQFPVIKQSFLTETNPCSYCGLTQSEFCAECKSKDEKVYILHNDICIVTYTPSADRPETTFNGQDIKDQDNLPVFYSTTSKSKKKAWEALKEQFTSNTTMHGAISILWDNGVKCHSWCRMD